MMIQIKKTFENSSNLCKFVQLDRWTSWRCRTWCTWPGKYDIKTIISKLPINISYFLIFSYIFCTWLDKDDYLKSSWNDIKITISTLIFTSDIFCTCPGHSRTFQLRPWWDYDTLLYCWTFSLLTAVTSHISNIEPQFLNQFCQFMKISVYIFFHI